MSCHLRANSSSCSRLKLTLKCTKFPRAVEKNAIIRRACGRAQVRSGYRQVWKSRLSKQAQMDISSQPDRADRTVMSEVWRVKHLTTAMTAMMTTQVISTGKNTIFEESPLSQAQVSWLEQQLRGQLCTQVQVYLQQQTVQVRHSSGALAQVAHYLLHPVQVWFTTMGLLVGQLERQLPWYCRQPDAQIEQEMEETQRRQLVGQVTQLALRVRQPTEGQLLRQLVLSRQQLFTQEEQEKAPLRQLAQGVTQVVQVPRQGQVRLGQVLQQLPRQQYSEELQLVQLLAVLKQVAQIGLQSSQAEVRRQVPAGQVETHWLPLYRKQPVTQVLQLTAPKQQRQGDSQAWHWVLLLLNMPSGQFAMQVELYRISVDRQPVQVLMVPTQVTQVEEQAWQTAAMEAQPVGQEERQVWGGLREQPDWQVRQQVLLVQLQHWLTQGTHRLLLPQQVLGQVSRQEVFIRKVGVAQAVQVEAVPTQFRQAEALQAVQVVELVGRKKVLGQADTQELLPAKRQLKEVQGVGRQLRHWAAVVQLLQGFTQKLETVSTVLVAMVEPLQERVKEKAPVVEKQLALAEKVREIVLEKEVSWVRVMLATVGVHTDPVRLRVQPEDSRVSQAGGTMTMRSRVGVGAAIAKVLVMVRVREEVASSTRELEGVWVAARAAGVKVAVAVACSTRQVVLSFVVVWTETVSVCTYQLFCSPLTDTVTVEGSVVGPAKVMTSSWEFCWFWLQLVLTPVALLLQENPEVTVIPAGRVSSSRSKEQWVCRKERVKAQVVTALTVAEAGAAAKARRVVGVVRVSTPAVSDSMRRELKQVSAVRGEVGLVEYGLIMLLITTTMFPSLATPLPRQLVKLNDSVPVLVIVQLPPAATPPTLTLSRVGVAAVEKEAVGKDILKLLPEGRALLGWMVTVKAAAAATMAEEEVRVTVERVTGSAVMVRGVARVLRTSVGVEVLQQQVARPKVEEGVVVGGLLSALRVIVRVVSPITTPFRFTTTVELLVSEQVDPAEQLQLLAAEEVTSAGRVSIILELAMRVLRVVMVRVYVVTALMEGSAAVTLAAGRVPWVNCRLTVVESTWQQEVPTRLRVANVMGREQLAKGALVRVKNAMNSVEKREVELVRLPMRRVLLAPEEMETCVVCWLEETQLQARVRSAAQLTRRQEIEEMGLVRLISRLMALVAAIARLLGAKATPLKVLGLLAAKVVVQVMQTGCEVDDTQCSRVSETEMGWVEAGLRALARVRLMLAVLLAEYSEEYVMTSLLKPATCEGVRMVHWPAQTAELVKLGKLVWLQALQEGNCTCRMEAGEMQTEGEQPRVQLAVAPVVAEVEAREQLMGALVIEMGAELVLQTFEELPDAQQVRVAVKDPAQRAVAVVKTSARVDTEARVGLRLANWTMLEPVAREQEAVGTTLLLRTTWQLASEENTKAEVKLTDASKFSEADVMAFIVMVQVEDEDRAVLGLAAEETTVKLSWAAASQPSRARVRQARNICIQFQICTNIIKQMLPKLAHANLFLHHPTELPPNPPNNPAPPQPQPPIEPEPWQTDFVDSAVLKQQRAIRQEINEMMHTDGEKTDAPPEEITVDPRKISKKLKKYQPANSSFSLFYGEKKQIEDRHAREPPRNPPTLPALTPRTHFPRIRPSPEPSPRNLSKEGLPRAGSGEFMNYISKIKDIYRQGCALRDKSQVLIHRIDLASNYLQRKYEKLGHQTEDMTGDVGTYHLEEETSKDYKKTLQPVPAYLLRK